MSRPITLANNNGVVINNQIKVFGAGAGEFPQSDSRLTSFDDLGLRFGTGDFTFEGWIRIRAINFQFDLVRISAEVNGGNSHFIRAVQGILQNKFQISIPEKQFVTTTDLDLDEWYFIAYTRNFGTWRFFVDGVQTDTGTNVIDYIKADSNNELIVIGDNNKPEPGPLLDDFRISNIARYTQNFTNPSQALQDDSNTLLLLPFDSFPIVDAFVPPITATATLNSNFTQQANSIKVRILNGSFNSSFNLQLELQSADLFNYVDVDYFVEDYTKSTLLFAQAQLNANTTLASQGDVFDTTGYFFPDYTEEDYVAPSVIEAVAPLNTEFNLDATPGHLRSVEAELETVATKLTAVGIIGDFFVVMDNNSSITVSAQVISSLSSNLDSEFTQTQIETRIRTTESNQQALFNSLITVEKLTGLSSNLDSEFDISVENDRILTSAIDLDSEFTQTAAVGFVKETLAELETIATKLTAVGIIGDFFVVMDTNTELTNDLDRIRTTEIVFESKFTTVIATGNLITPVIDLASTATQTTDSQRIRNNQISLNSAVDIIIDGGRTRTVSEQLNSNFAVTATANITNSFFVVMDSAFDLDSNAFRIKALTAEIESEFQQNVIADRFAQADAALSVETTQSTVGGYLFDVDVALETIATKLIAVAKIADFFVNHDVNATLTAEPKLFRSTSVDLQSVFGQATTADRFAQALAQLQTTANIEISANSIRELITVLDAEFDYNVAAGLLADAAATLDNEFSLDASGGFVVLLQYILKIRNEDRTLKLPKESRTINITQENRQITVRR